MKLSRPLVMAGIAALVLSGCGTAVDGEPVTADTPTSATRTSTPPRTTTTTVEQRPVAHDVDQIIKDIEQFWARGGIHLDVGSRVDEVPTCGTPSGRKRYPTSPAVYCFHEDVISYRPSLPTMPDAALILAHEMGHAVQDDRDWLDGADGDEKVPGTDIPVREVSADCLAGVYIAAEEPSLEGSVIDGRGGVRTSAFQRGVGLDMSQAQVCFTDYER